MPYELTVTSEVVTGEWSEDHYPTRRVPAVVARNLRDGRRFRYVGPVELRARSDGEALVARIEAWAARRGEPFDPEGRDYWEEDLPAYGSPAWDAAAEAGLEGMDREAVESPVRYSM